MAADTGRVTGVEKGIAPTGYRLPAGTSLGGVRLQVADLDRSLAYYLGVLGLRVLASSPGTASLGVPGSDEPLVSLRAVPGTRPVPRRGTYGLYHFAILVPDRALLGRFVAHLWSMGVQAGMSDHEVSEAIYLTDPDGLGIEVYADRPRAGWRYRGPELAMSTEPLDVARLVRAGSGLPWLGMPAGTTMGHIHLHVGDLEAAAAFYQGTLGFDLTVWSYPGALFFSAGGYHHHVGTNTWSPGPSPADDQARLLEWEIRVPGGAPIERATDPWGTSVVIAPSPDGRDTPPPSGDSSRPTA